MKSERLAQTKLKISGRLGLAAILLALAAALLVILLIPHGTDTQQIAHAEIVSTEYQNRDASFQTAMDTDRLYLYFEEYGIVNVYARSGPFLYGIKVGHSRNGKGAIAIVDGLLYVKARGNIIYIFDGEELVDTAVGSYTAWKQGDRKYTDYEKAMGLGN